MAREIQHQHHTALLVMRILFTIFALASIAYIFLNSSEIGELSSVRSKEATVFINNTLDKVGTNITLSELFVRKLGHFAEYSLLGFWLMLTLRVYTRRLIAFVAWPLLGGIATAVLDEFYQTLVPGRSGEVRDVVIDFAGVVCGLCVALCIQLVARAIWWAIRGSRQRP